MIAAGRAGVKVNDEHGCRATSSLGEGVLAGDPRAIARTLTLLENGGAAGRQLADRLFPHSGRAIVVGITGPPGAGKSTLVNALVGSLRRRRQASVAVIAVDPSSPWSRGALLGDRIRMRDHYTDSGVFIRSLSSRGRLGGLADVALPAVRVLDAAGFDVVVVETVGIGQAEVDIARLADCVVFVTVPGTGDGIQAAKSGVLEVADLFVVNRADDPASTTALQELESMLHLRRGAATPPVLRTIATTGAGTEELLAAVDEWIVDRLGSGELAARRTESLVAEARGLITTRAGATVLGAFDAPLPEPLRQALAQRRTSPDQVAELLLAERLPAAGPHQPIGGRA